MEPAEGQENISAESAGQVTENTTNENEKQNAGRNQNRRIKWIKTAFLYATFMGLGIASALIPSTILDLRDQLRLDTYTMSFTYTVQYAGTFIGGVTAGFLNRPKSLNTIHVLSASLLIFAGIVISVPWIYDVIVEMITVGLWGIFNGIADTVINLLIIQVWDVEVGPYLQALHLLHAIGAFITPVIARPFLSARYSNLSANTTSDLLANETFDGSNVTQMINASDFAERELPAMTESYIRYAYMIVGGYVGLTGLSLGLCSAAQLFWVTHGDTGNSISDPEKNENKKDDATDIEPLPLPRLQKIKFLILLFVILFLYGSLQSTNGGFLLVLAVDGLYWSKQLGTYLVSAFWIAYSVSRVFGIVIFATKVITVGQLLALNVFLIMTSNITLVIFAESHFIVPWLATLVSAMGQGTLLIAIMVWYQENIMPITGIIPSIVTAAMSIGSISMPLLTGFLIDKVHFMCFPYALLTMSGLITASAFTIYVSLILYRSQT